MTKKSFLLAIAPLFVLTLLVGCGPKVIKTDVVTGTIKVDGEPTGGVNVYFVPTTPEGSNGYAKTDDSGHYELQTLLGAANAGTTPGVYKVKFDYQIAVPDGTMEENGQTIEKFKSVSKLDPKWNDQETSGVEVEVKAGVANVFDFEITSK